jgi:hypothetical protein
MDIASIQFLDRSRIDTVRWDQCVQKAKNSLIYGYSFYLDHMSPGWKGLVLGNYDYVMPLTWRKKWGIVYLYQPPFLQQGGVFSGQPITDELLSRLLAEIKIRFRFAEIFLNYNNRLPGLVEQQNFLLELHRPYEEIKANYKTDLRNNLKLAEKNVFHYSEYSLQQVLSHFSGLYSSRLPGISAHDYKAFSRLCHYCRQQGWLLTRSVTDNEGAVLSSALLLKKDGRMYLLHSTTFPKGRKLRANHFLIDRLIREFCSQPWILDFEGSAIAGIAYFYKNFGAQNQPYYFWRHNGLPWPLKLIMK